jgi:hypothetical protein
MTLGFVSKADHGWDPGPTLSAQFRTHCRRLLADEISVRPNSGSSPQQAIWRRVGLSLTEQLAASPTLFSTAIASHSCGPQSAIRRSAFEARISTRRSQATMDMFEALRQGAQTSLLVQRSRLYARPGMKSRQSAPLKSDVEVWRAWGLEAIYDRLNIRRCSAVVYVCFI